MDFSIAAILAQDGLTSGAIYALLALALVLVFSVTRVIFIPQGEFVAYGALTLAAMQTNKFPQSASCWARLSWFVLNWFSISCCFLAAACALAAWIRALRLAATSVRACAPLRALGTFASARADCMPPTSERAHDPGLDGLGVAAANVSAFFAA